MTGPECTTPCGGVKKDDARYSIQEQLIEREYGIKLSVRGVGNYLLRKAAACVGVHFSCLGHVATPSIVSSPDQYRQGSSAESS
jgi:hypothetical protein